MWMTILTYDDRFCKEKAFTALKISTCLGIFKEVLIADEICSVTPSKDMANSFEYFRSLLFKHSIPKPPKSVQIFNYAEVEMIMEYALLK